MTALVTWLAATIVALAAVIWSGASRRRTLHYALVLVLLGCLALAIRAAERYGEGLVFEGLAGTVHDVHMVVVVLTLASFLPLVVSGVRLARARGAAEPAARARHRALAGLFVALVLVTSALGVAMTVLAGKA